MSTLLTFDFFFNQISRLVPWLRQSERAKHLFAAHTQHCLIHMDNSISNISKGNSNFTVHYSSTTMVVTAHMDCLAYTDRWGIKVNEQLNLNMLNKQDMKEALIKIKQHKAKFQAGLGHSGMEVLIKVDWASFVHNNKFQHMKDPAHKLVIHNITNLVVKKGLFNSSQGLLKWASNSKHMWQLLLEQVNKIIIKLVPQGSLTDVGNSYYKVQEQAATALLILTAHMDCLTYTDGWGPKVDNCLGLHYFDKTYMWQALDALAAKTAKLHGELAGLMKPALQIDWDLFVSDPKFLQQ